MKKILIAVIISVILGSILIPSIVAFADDEKNDTKGESNICVELKPNSNVTPEAGKTCIAGERDEACCPTGGLVFCGTACCRCRLCDVFKLIDRLIDFMVFKIAPIAAIILIIIGGAMFLMSSGNPGMISRAKSIIISVIIGLCIMYGSYMIVGFVLRSVGLADWTKDMYSSWLNEGIFEIDCGETSNGTGSGDSSSSSITDFCNSFSAEAKKSCNIYSNHRMSDCTANPCNANYDSTTRCRAERQGPKFVCVDVN
ncbi:MAG: hypothetical protein PHV47_01850 [Candidatus Pacebacteria bacterium]|nr:hypothetical protein [Candidatus Paceibacterota bacterium]